MPQQQGVRQIRVSVFAQHMKQIRRPHEAGLHGRAVANNHAR